MSRRALQVRYNLGSVKLQLADDVQTVQDLKRLLHEKSKIPLDRMVLTRDQHNTDIIPNAEGLTLSQAGVRSGDTVYLCGRYEKKVISQSFISGGVLIPAGEQIIKCSEDAGPQPVVPTPDPGSKPPRTESTIPSIIARNDEARRELNDPDEVASATADSQQVPLLGSPQVRAPDAVKKMTLFGPDEDEPGGEMVFDPAAVEELRLAGLTELEILEALSIDAKGRRNPNDRVGYRAEVSRQSQAIQRIHDMKNKDAPRTGKERRAAKRERIGLDPPKILSTEDSSTLAQALPPQHPTGSYGNRWAALEDESVDDASNSLGHATKLIRIPTDDTSELMELCDFDLLEQQELLKKFEEDQKRLIAASRLQNERNIDSIRRKALLSVAAQEFDEQPSSQGDFIDISSLGIDEEDAALQRSLLAQFELNRKNQETENELSAVERDPYQRIMQQRMLEGYARRKAASAQVPAADPPFLEIDPEEVAAQVALLRQYEKSSLLSSSSRISETDKSSFIPEDGKKAEKYKQHGSGGLTGSPRATTKTEARSKVLAESAVEILSNRDRSKLSMDKVANKGIVQREMEAGTWRDGPVVRRVSSTEKPGPPCAIIGHRSSKDDIKLKESNRDKSLPFKSESPKEVLGSNIYSGERRKDDSGDPRRIPKQQPQPQRRTVSNILPSKPTGLNSLYLDVEDPVLQVGAASLQPRAPGRRHNTDTSHLKKDTSQEAKPLGWVRGANGSKHIAREFESPPAPKLQRQPSSGSSHRSGAAAVGKRPSSSSQLGTIGNKSSSRKTTDEDDDNQREFL